MSRMGHHDKGNEQVFTRSARARSADGRLAEQFANSGLSDAEMRKLIGGMLRASSHAVSWPNFSELIRVNGNFDTHEQRVKRNAWRMLDQIMRRVPSLDRDLAVLPMH